MNLDDGKETYFGIAGWSYEDWKDYVYPAGVKDKLRYIAGYFDAIEINSTFYRPPGKSTSSSWLERISDLPEFFFTAKLHRDITHEGKIESSTVKAFHEGLAPLVEHGKLHHLLAQFKYDFRDTPANRKHLQRISAEFRGLCNLTFELRDNSWQSPDALDFLSAQQVTVANLDLPLARNSFSLRKCLVGEHAYLRLHGRNRKAWFSKAGRDETYNYLYSEKELQQVASRALELAKNSKSLTLIANNHYQGKEAVTSLQLKSMISGRRVAVPEKLIENYPQLGSISRSTAE